MEPKFIIELPVSELHVVLNALAARPYGEVFKVVATIQEQAARQSRTEQPRDPSKQG